MYLCSKKSKDNNSRMPPGWSDRLAHIFQWFVVRSTWWRTRTRDPTSDCSALTVRPESLFVVDDIIQRAELKYLTRTGRTFPHCAWHPYCAAQRSYCAVDE
jgi:hypothetical protein